MLKGKVRAAIEPSCKIGRNDYRVLAVDLGIHVCNIIHVNLAEAKLRIGPTFLIDILGAYTDAHMLNENRRCSLSLVV